MRSITLTLSPSFVDKAELWQREGMRFHAPLPPSAVLKTRKTESNSGRLIRRIIKTPFYCPPLPLPPGNDVTMLHEIASRLHTRAHTIRFHPLRYTVREQRPTHSSGKETRKEKEKEREREIKHVSRR